jgi:OOP family OmpA-OmpF porin
MDNNGYSITVADVTIVLSKLVGDLGSHCHMAPTGVLFDFDRSTLTPESEQVGAIMARDATLRLEVQGAIPMDSAATLTTSQCPKRARSVVVRLTQHGVVVDRLLARGYGKTRPFAFNSTDEGRARNRRVEIANLARKAKS